ncbi:PAS domain S-box protein [Bradyrhizobium sp. ARR65]|uniref:PAS domain S-box protein n=1 Tax=Bradyrhizobium sp. ARR65 TaxID=1040989 RepID=UPI0004655386|nr:PAS domain S-box protein [Bradyrhizobium sp. ARR65]
MNIQKVSAQLGVETIGELACQNPSPAFLDQLPIAIYACDAAGRILWFNGRAAELWGRVPRIGDDSERFCGSHKFYFDGRPITREQTPMAEVLRSGIAIRGAEGKMERPDGSHIWVVIYIAAVRDADGQVVGAINCFHESTTGGRLEAPDAAHDDWVRARDARLAATYEHIGAGIVEVDRNGRMLRVNRQLSQLTGYSADELLGRTIFQETLPEDVPEDRAQFERQLAGEIDRYTIEKRIYRKDGGYIWASVTSSSVRDAAGSFLYAVRLQYDITDRKRAEQALSRRMEEQAALFAFSERLQHCKSVQQIHHAALDAITHALGCARASILLFDATGVMRFVASRGLSEEYRRAVEGHSPWAKDAPNPQPVYMEEVAASDLPNELKQTIGREKIAAVAFIPIVKDGRLAGKFMAYHDAPHRFTEPEIDVALTLARLLGFSLSQLEGEQARKLAERDARQLAAIVESSHDAIVSKNLDGIIQTWNAGAEQLFGYRPEEAIGRGITMLIPDDRPDEEAGILARIRRGERVDHFETVRRRKDGRLIDISLTISPIRDREGRIIGASKIARDITERKLAEVRLQESERRLQELLAAIPAAIYTTDADGRITYFNEAAVELAGRTPTLHSDEWCVTWKLYNPDGTPLPHDQCPMAIALKEGRAVRGAEAVAERPDGTRVPFIPFPTPLRDASGKIVGAINMLVDISERKQAETQQRLLLNELNHRTKNNMQVLQSLLFSAARHAKSEEACRVLSEASGRIAAMAAAQRVLYGKSDASRFAADEFMRAVTETVRQTLPQDIPIVCEAASGVLSNDVAMPLALILNELVTNAAKHGGKDASKRMVRVGLNRHDGEFELYVEDGGPGFELEAVRQRSSGLRLVLGLARQLHGSFEVSRTPSRASLRFGKTN